MTSPLTPLETRIAALIAKRAAAQPAASAVWIFGSRARGASTENSDLDVAVEFSGPETQVLRGWLESVRREAEALVADQWPGFVNLVGLFAGDVDQRLAQRVRTEGFAFWRRRAPPQDAVSVAAPAPTLPMHA